MFNVFTFTKSVTNTTKLERELRANANYGALYNFCTIKGDQLTVHFTANLNQTQIDELSAQVAAFSNVSVYDTLYSYLKNEIDPFVEQLLVQIRAENIEMGITQANKTTEVLGFFEAAWMLPGRTRAVSLQSSLDTGSLTVTVEILLYLIANPNLYSDLTPFITADRLTIWKDKILAELA